MKKIDTAQFAHDPNISGFRSLATAFSKYIAGRAKRDDFMVKWWKASKDARRQFKKFVETFDEVTKSLFEGEK